MSKKLSIVIPAYNEARTINLILDKVLAVDLVSGMKKEIIIVNDHSSDNTDNYFDKKQYLYFFTLRS